MRGLHQVTKKKKSTFITLLTLSWGKAATPPLSFPHIHTYSKTGCYIPTVLFHDTEESVPGVLGSFPFGPVARRHGRAGRFLRRHHTVPGVGDREVKALGVSRV